jgi:hypothetical protein
MLPPLRAPPSRAVDANHTLLPVAIAMRFVPVEARVGRLRARSARAIYKFPTFPPGPQGGFSLFSTGALNEGRPVIACKIDGKRRRTDFKNLLNRMENEMSRTPNDDRSDSMNPNNDAYEASMDNRANQLNPNNDAYQGSNSAGEDQED